MGMRRVAGALRRRGRRAGGRGTEGGPARTYPDGWVDVPPTGSELGAGWETFRGWLAVPAGAAVAGPRLVFGDGAIHELRREPRPDALPANPDADVLGFAERVYLGGHGAGEPLVLDAVVDDRCVELARWALRADDRTRPFELLVDSPVDTPGDQAGAHTVLVRGWLAVADGVDLERIEVDSGAGRVPTRREARPDVVALGPYARAEGFTGFVEIAPDAGAREWALEVTVGGDTFRTELGYTVAPARRDAFFDAKRAKLARIRPHLRCPRVAGPGRGARCGGELDDVSPEEMGCSRCGTAYPRGGRNFNMLTSDLRVMSGIEQTENVSSLGYDAAIQEIVDEFRDGLVLDNGCGLRLDYLDNVVNFEIVDYLSTDVLGVGESLPFADDTFDAVLSIAVLEHVRDPWGCAREIARVVRPGGKVWAGVPFLQAYHGYPHHYYNMTISGLENLFADSFEIEALGLLPTTGHPIWTLHWLLSRYAAGLPPDVAHRFSALTVGELLSAAAKSPDWEFVAELDEQTATDLGHVNYILARRKG